MATIPISLRRSIIQRADNRCEYCGISQIGQVANFHIDHVISIVSGGETSSENLALACVSCSLRKGARQNIEDSETGEIVPIFNPRQQVWKEHFKWNDVQVVGLTITRSGNGASSEFEPSNNVSNSSRREIVRSSSTTMTCKLLKLIKHSF